MDCCDNPSAMVAYLSSGSVRRHLLQVARRVVENRSKRLTLRRPQPSLRGQAVSHKFPISLTFSIYNVILPGKSVYF